MPILSAVIALAGAFGGVWLTQRQTRLREEAQYQRQRQDRAEERRQEVLLDMMQHITATEQWISLLTDEVTAWSDRSGSWHTPTALLTPRVDLYVGGRVAVDWTSYVWRIETLQEAHRLSLNSTEANPAMDAEGEAVTRLAGLAGALRLALPEIAGARSVRHRPQDGRPS
ncbi:MAG: hypothetical protein ABW022_11560 [Actinoplanes sp.]